VSYTDIVIKKPTLDVTSFGVHKDLISVGETKENFSFLSLTANLHDFGVQLNKTLENCVVKHVTLMDGTVLDLYSLISSYNKTTPLFTEEFNFYQAYSKKDSRLIIAVRSIYHDDYTLNYIYISIIF